MLARGQAAAGGPVPGGAPANSPYGNVLDMTDVLFGNDFRGAGPEMPLQMNRMPSPGKAVMPPVTGPKAIPGGPPVDIPGGPPVDIPGGPPVDPGIADKVRQLIGQGPASIGDAVGRAGGAIKSHPVASIIALAAGLYGGSLAAPGILDRMGGGAESGPGGIDEDKSAGGPPIQSLLTGSADGADIDPGVPLDDEEPVVDPLVEAASGANEETASDEVLVRLGDTPSAIDPENMAAEYRDTAIDQFGPEQRLTEYLRGRGLDENSMMFVMMRDMLRNQAYSAQKLYSAYGDSQGADPTEHGKGYGDYFNRMMGDVGYRREVAGSARDYLGSVDAFAPDSMMADALGGFKTNTARQEHLGSLEQAMLRATLPRWMASSLGLGASNRIEGGYARHLIDNAAPSGQLQNYFSPWAGA